MAEIGDIYTCTIQYDDDPTSSKSRPVLIINVENGFSTFAEITSTPPKSPPVYYDQFKEPITGWKEAGLANMSYVKTHKLHRVEERELGKYRGSIHDEDELVSILTRIIEVNS